MAKRWLSVALIVGSLVLGADASAQSFRCGEPHEGPQMYPGPMQPQQAPPGPGGDMSLPADVPNAFDDCGRKCCRPDYCCNGMWFSAEGLGWAMRDPHLNQPLVLPVLGTVAQNQLEYHFFAGFRGQAGFWLNSDRTWSIEGGGFVLERKGTSLQAPPDSVQAASRLWGVDGDVVCVGSSCGCDIALVSGYAYRDLQENININQAAAVDQIRTRNQLSGGLLGVRLGGCTCSGLFIAGQASCAFGWNHETVLLEGTGGGLVTAANAGRLAQDKFAIIPQGDVKIGYQVNRNFMLYAGWTYLWWHRVVRPGDEIPLAAGTPVQFHETNFWAQGLNVGFELRY